MSKKVMALLVGACVGLLFAANGIFAGTVFEDVIKMETPELGAHKKGIVEFTHAKHANEYEKGEISCGDCHHDDKGKPLTLNKGDDVKRCVDCHTGVEKVKGEKISKKDKIKNYYEDAVHSNCIDCHKDSNKKAGDPKGKGPAPTSCTKCHPKN